MRSVVKKWGKSASVRIPRAVMQAAGFRIGQRVEVKAEADRIVVEIVQPVEYELAELVKGITRENVHAAVEFF